MMTVVWIILLCRFLYDASTHTYTVGKYLADLQRRYGGVDSILFWPTYPNIGVDDRNQLDWFRTLPGGLDAVRNVTEQFHNAGVKVLWCVNHLLAPFKWHLSRAAY